MRTLETKETKNLTKPVLRSLLAMVCFVGAQQLLGIIYEMFLLGTLGDLPGEYLKMIYTMGTLLITLVAAFPLFCAVMRVKPKDLQLLFQRKKNCADFYGAGQYLILSLGIASLPVLIQAFLIVNGQLDASTLSISTGMEFLTLIIQFMIVMPVVEEMMFRGVILNRFRCYGATVAVVASTLIFAFGHLNLVNTLVSLPMGFILGYVALRTGNIWLPLMIHVVTNLFGSLVAPSALGSGVSPAFYSITVFSLIAVLAAIVLVIVKRGKLFSVPKDVSC